MTRASRRCKSNFLTRKEDEFFSMHYIDSKIGYGIFSKKDFEDGDFLLQYKGERISDADAKKRAGSYKGSFIYYGVKDQYGKSICIDATKVSGLGKIVNDAPFNSKIKYANSTMKRKMIDGNVSLCLYANKYISCGTEIRYDYGEDVEEMPWRKEDYYCTPFILSDIKACNEMVIPYIKTNAEQQSLETLSNDKEEENVHTSDAEEETVDLLPNVLISKDISKQDHIDFNISKMEKEVLTIADDNPDMDVEKSEQGGEEEEKKTDSSCKKASQLQPVKSQPVHQVVSDVGDIEERKPLNVITLKKVLRMPPLHPVLEDMDDKRNLDDSGFDLDTDLSVVGTNSDVSQDEDFSSGSSSEEDNDCDGDYFPASDLTDGSNDEEENCVAKETKQSTRESIQAPEETKQAPEETIQAPEETIQAPEESIQAPEESIQAPEESIQAPEESIQATANHNNSAITVACVTAKNTGKRKWDKTFQCVYCNKRYAKLPRHYETRHKEEAEVKHLMLLKPSGKDDEHSKSRKNTIRKSLLEKLRKLGSSQHNFKVLEEGKGELIVEKRPSNHASKSYTEYLPCEFCRGFYYRVDLHRHLKNCNLKGNENHSRVTNRVQGIASMLLPVDQSISTDLMNIFKRMKIDEVSTLCKTDLLIIKYGNKLCHKHMNNDDQSKYISNKLRELARLTIKMKDSNPLVTTLDDVISPQLFPKVVLAVTQLCGWDKAKETVKTPSLGIKLGQLLGKISALVISQAITSGNNDDRRRGKDFLTLVQKEWDDEVARVSRTDLDKKKWNKPQLIPLTEDLQILNKHLDNLQKTSMEALKQDKFDANGFKDLASSTLASIIIFNRRRQGEASKLRLDQTTNLNESFNEEVMDSLTEFERKLCNTLKRIEIRGKRGRKVPIILTKQNEEAVNMLVKYREFSGVSSENPFVFPVSSNLSLNCIRGSDALRKHVDQCHLKRPDVINSTKLRKHVATLSQVMNLEENELEMLATYLGHDIQVHRNYYRLPENTVQLAKCGKLLTMFNEGKCKDLVGKRLEDIDVMLNDIDEDEEEEESDEAENDSGAEEKDEKHSRKRKIGQLVNPSKLSKVIKKSKMSNVESSSSKSSGKKQWSEEEIKIVEHHFKSFFIGTSLPGKKACEELVNKHPCLSRRTWSTVKDFVRNRKLTLIRKQKALVANKLK